MLRLFRRNRARFSDDLVHERVICEGEVARLKAPLMHHPVLRLEDALSRMDRYSTARAEMIVKSGRRVWFFTGILRGWWTFIQTYFIRLGFLDGREGFLLAVANAEGTYYRYMKAWLKRVQMSGDRPGRSREVGHPEPGMREFRFGANERMSDGLTHRDRLKGRGRG